MSGTIISGGASIRCGGGFTTGSCASGCGGGGRGGFLFAGQQETRSKDPHKIAVRPTRFDHETVGNRVVTEM
jgi:hypothetical protein